MQQLTYQKWDEYPLESNDGFLDTSKYKTEASSNDKRKQLQSQISQTRDFINNTVKNSVDTLEAQTIVSADENLTVTKIGTTTTLKVNVSASGEATKSYVDSQDALVLQDAKDYTDTHQTNPYPIGSIYLSVVNTNPSTLFGGTWEQLKDRFLLGAGDVYSNGATGGESSHTLTVEEMPSHSHNYRRLSETSTQVASGTQKTIQDNEGWADSYQTATSGSSQAHNNMPPYLVVYMWKRTS